MDQLQMKMVRRIVGWRRLPEESWRDTMSRMKIRIRNARSQYPFEDWSRRYACNLWRYGIHLTRKTSSHWERLLTLERQLMKNDESSPFVPYRSPGRPKRRWDDYFKHFFDRSFPNNNSHWMYLLESSCSSQMETDFINFVCEWYNVIYVLVGA